MTNIDDILAANENYNPNEYAEEEKNCLYQAICTMIGDPQWSPSWFLKLVREHNGYPPASELKQLEQWCPLGVPTKVYDGHEVHWNGESLIVKETGEKHSLLYFERVILCYQTHEGGHAVCIRKFQIKEYAHLVWDAVIVRDHTSHTGAYRERPWHNPDLDSMLRNLLETPVELHIHKLPEWHEHTERLVDHWYGPLMETKPSQRLSRGMRLFNYTRKIETLCIDEAHDAGGGILDPTPGMSKLREEAREILRRYIDEHSDQIRALLEKKHKEEGQE